MQQGSKERTPSVFLAWYCDPLLCKSANSSLEWPHANQEGGVSVAWTWWRMHESLFLKYFAHNEIFTVLRTTTSRNKCRSRKCFSAKGIGNLYSSGSLLNQLCSTLATRYWPYLLNTEIVSTALKLTNWEFRVFCRTRLQKSLTWFNHCTFKKAGND